MNLAVKRLFVELVPDASAGRAEKDAARLLVEAIDESGVPRLLARFSE